MIEKRNCLDRVDRPVLVAEINQTVYRLVVSHARLRIANVVELHDVACGQDLPRKTSDVAGLKRQSTTQLTTIRQVQAVVVWSCNTLVQRRLNALIFIRGNS